MPDIRAVVTDLDGTLVDEEKRISAATLRAAADLAARRIPLILATARGPTWVARLEALLPTVAVAVCCGGAVGWAPATREMLWRDTIPPEAIERIVRHVCRQVPEAGIAAYDAERWRVTEGFVRNGPSRPGPREVTAAHRLSEGSVCGMSVCYPGDRVDELRALLAGIEPPPIVQVSKPDMIDLGPHGTDKARGVLRALEVVDVRPDHAIAFGDMDLDLPMFAACGYSVAVANAHPDVIAAASYVTACVHDDGFARTLGDLGLVATYEAGAAPACSCPPAHRLRPARGRPD